MRGAGAGDVYSSAANFVAKMQPRRRRMRLSKSAPANFSSSSSSSQSSTEGDGKLLVVGRSVCESSTSVDGAEITFLRCQEKSCCCLSMNGLPGGKGGQEMCGWESWSVAKNSRNSYHNFVLPWSVGKGIDLHGSGVKTRNLMSKSNSSLGETESKSSVNYHGYISSTSVKPYPFEHRLDGDTSFYIKQYRQIRACRNLKKSMQVGSMSATIGQIKPKVITLGSEGCLRTLASKSLRKRAVCFICALKYIIIITFFHNFSD